ncbi:cysteine and histidine-rich domain-containing protein 1-like [Daphnia pulicaria]|uniref:cysteine and histidine-rich domain-containing protein 1-like n=1 Tax=Daphnia pulicaria TaxID=35523 RepID=UPI001EECCF0C|nr:cysteine and histidine-rich domain-containing protein 1-like [Daphnia pulicaria]XP_046631657.1 cysteine and histidine-rich domain-containing protein 1-like [Daphnia pulicaria]
MSSEGSLCYNRGCGKRFNPDQNGDDTCIHHPGAPFFHDAYKGWSCCKKKCTDFTEFLNIKGCSTSAHNGEKPVEPEKPEVDKSKASEVIEYKAPEPIKPSSLLRPPFESPLIKLKYSISASLQQELEKVKATDNSSQIVENNFTSDGIRVGASCKNGGCKQTYVNESSNDSTCTYHAGVPIFHEGLKYWTCCTRRTSDFQAFLDQEGCSTGTHVWKTEKEEQIKKSVQCRQDWMQTGTHVIVNIYCKKPDPTNESLTYVEVNPIRLRVRINLLAGGPSYNSDIELRGIIDTVNSSVTYTPNKVEIKLKKAEPMSWNKLDIPRQVPVKAVVEDEKKKQETEENLPKVDVLDLSDL